MQDWKSAQTAAYEKAGANFNINQGWDIDGYVMEAEVIFDTPFASADYFLICIQKGNSPGFTCAKHTFDAPSGNKMTTNGAIQTWKSSFPMTTNTGPLTNAGVSRDKATMEAFLVAPAVKAV